MWLNSTASSTQRWQQWEHHNNLSKMAILEKMAYKLTYSFPSSPKCDLNTNFLLRISMH